MTVYQKIKCETKTIYRSIKTGERYETEEAFLKQHSKEDLATDVVVEVPDLPIFSKTQK
ncbi:MAG: hypothetical protein ACR2MH_06445 [Patiriisocius sp.]|jgi:hypothetical protein|tara:strand:- start:401 stop:577 length:177 start_codon:yes stop_codon:yes gene_type:complete